jgi:hydrogenase maturation protease
MVRLLGGTIGRIIIVGCEPAELVERIGLSAPVEHAVEEAVKLVSRLVVSPKEEAT